MKKYFKILFIIIMWIIAGVFLYKEGLITTDIHKINSILGSNPLKMVLIFITLSTLRVVFFIPQTVFIILGSIVFGPYEGFLLSFISLILSQSIMYFIGRYLRNLILGKDFIEKNEGIINQIRKYGYKFLALGIMCPVTPSDMITLSAGCIELNYFKSIVTIALADGPMIFLYGIIGEGFKNSMVFSILSILVVVGISYYTWQFWNKINVRGV